MAISTIQAVDKQLAKVKTKFQEFDKTAPRSKGRRYPKKLLNLLRRALEKGISPAVLRRHTRVSHSVVKRLVPARAEAPMALRKNQPIKARRLEVVGLS